MKLKYYTSFPSIQYLILTLHLYNYFSHMFWPYGHHQANVHILWYYELHNS